MTTLNPAYVLAPFHELLTNCQANVLVGLRLIEKIDEWPPATSEELSFFQISFALRPTTLAESKTLFKRWLLLTGLGDIQKAVRVTLERFFVLKSIQQALESGFELNWEEREAELGAKASKFHLPELVKTVETLSGEPFQFEEQIASINNARNCLEHDHGIVAPKRCNNLEKNRLLIRGRRFKIFFKNREIETPAVLGRPGPENAALMLGAEDFVIEFSVKQAIDLSLNQFIDILNTCIFLRADIETKLGKRIP
jgi:hypothetical protein